MADEGKSAPRVCKTCPWRLENHGKPHKGGWYRISNLRRLWAGLRSGRAPGMICHSTDPKNVEYGGDAPVKPGHEAECGGALFLMITNMNDVAAGRPQTHQPPLTRHTMLRLVERHLFEGGLAVEPFEGDLGVPKPKKDKELRKEEI